MLFSGKCFQNWHKSMIWTAIILWMKSKALIFVFTKITTKGNEQSTDVATDGEA